MFEKVLIANRGEIAVRVIRACRAMGIKTVAVYSTADRQSLHTYLADEAVCIGPAQARDSYLNIPAIITAAKGTGADAIHPGYGFLSENSTFAKMCRENDITFIGPTPEVIDRMGNKSQARRTMMDAGVPVVPGTKKGIHDVGEALEQARKIGWPIMIKASSGGGGKGMRVSESEEDFADMFNIAQRESVNAFADNTMYLERAVQNPRHVEVQIIADNHGNVVALGERDCSVQRNHQKMIEESPSPALDEELRARMMDDAVKAARAVGYTSAGTIEFLLDDDRNYYFMEMNTRIQVEHGVTELVTGVDLVRQQLRIASGLSLDMEQSDIRLTGHAIECRINAENPGANFAPCPGRVEFVHFPGGAGVRVDSCLYNGCELSPWYDSLAAKLMVHAPTRLEAIRKMRRALEEFTLEGFPTNAELSYQIMYHPVFVRGGCTTAFLDEHLPELLDFSRRVCESEGEP